MKSLLNLDIKRKRDRLRITLLNLKLIISLRNFLKGKRVKLWRVLRGIGRGLRVVGRG